MAVAATVLAASAMAAAQPASCPDKHPIDGVERAGTPQACLVMRRYESDDPHWRHALVVFLHGDNGGRIEWHDDRGSVAKLSRKLRVPVIALQRPGYRSSLGTSDGFTTPGDDDYTADNVDLVAETLQSLRTFFPDRRILLVGHSGGAAMTALVAARHPKAADAYLLAGCPCDIGPWREWRSSQRGNRTYWARSLSPLQEAGAIAPGTTIRLLVGTADDNTLPKFSEAFVAKLKAQGVATDLTYAPDATHGSVLRSAEFYALVREMAQALNQSVAKADGS